MTWDLMMTWDLIGGAWKLGPVMRARALAEEAAKADLPIEIPPDAGWAHAA
jgi:hypothetical protein